MVPIGGDDCLLETLVKCMQGLSFFPNTNTCHEFTLKDRSYEDPFEETTTTPSASTPFESQAYEALFSTLLTIEHHQLIRLQNQGKSLLQEMKSKEYGTRASYKVQERVLEFKDALKRMMNKVDVALHAFHELLDDDERLALMNLTMFRQNPNLYKYNCEIMIFSFLCWLFRLPLDQEALSLHEIIEDLLEGYLLEYASLHSNLFSINDRLIAAEALVNDAALFINILLFGNWICTLGWIAPGYSS